jgi:predicted metal-dependent phosphoesterase TrpH
LGEAESDGLSASFASREDEVRVDLHTHTDRSDGDLTPEALVAAAAAGGLQLLAVTDHDTTRGVAPAMAAAEGTGLRVVSGVELSSTHQGREVHVLGYGMDPEHPSIREHGEAARTRRIARMSGMVDRLRSQGIDITLDEVRDAAGAGGVMVGRPHLARVLVKKGHADSVPHAFDTLIGDRHPAFVPTALATPVGAVERIRGSGGLAVWAHPPMDLLDDLLPGLVYAGLRGLEAYRPGWSGRRTRQVTARAQEAGLFLTGGSDFHGPQRNGELGDFWVQGTLVRPFLDELGLDPG